MNRYDVCMLSTLLIRDKETRDSFRGLYITCALAIFFVISGFRSCSEVRYTMFGEPATARVINARELELRENEGRTDITYQYEDGEGAMHKETYRTDVGDPVPSRGDSIEILYLSTSPSVSKPAWSRSMAPFYWFLGIGSAGGLWLFFQWRALP